MPSAMEQAVRRLDAALQELEAAVAQRLSPAVGMGEPSDEVRMLTADRARLAETLDQSEARARKLESVNRDVSRRLQAAADAVRAVLAGTTERS